MIGPNWSFFLLSSDSDWMGEPGINSKPIGITRKKQSALLVSSHDHYHVAFSLFLTR